MVALEERKVAIIAILCSLFLLGSMSGIAFASSGNWVEVTRFEGNESTQTESFTCDHVEWRIKWEYDPGHIHFPFQSSFQVTTIAQREDYPQDYVVDSISSLLGGYEGISNIYDDNGRFYLNIGLSGNYKIIVEQNIDSRSIVESSNNWVEVARFTGVTEGVRNESFTSDCAEWRIRWSYNAKPESMAPPIQFHYNVEEIKGEFSEILMPETDRGIMYVHKAGSFNLTIHSYAYRYSIIIEKNLEFIPEFPSWIILPLFLVATAFALAVRKRGFHNISKPSNQL
jgi:hypothetical protein